MQQREEIPSESPFMDLSVRRTSGTGHCSGAGELQGPNTHTQKGGGALTGGRGGADVRHSAGGAPQRTPAEKIYETDQTSRGASGCRKSLDLDYKKQPPTGGSRPDRFLWLLPAEPTSAQLRWDRW